MPTIAHVWRRLSTTSFDEVIDMPSGRLSVHTSLVPVAMRTARCPSPIALPIDTTDRNRAEEALRESERRYREIFENTWDGIFVVDATPSAGLHCRVQPCHGKDGGDSSAEAVGRFNEESLPRKPLAQ